jgi:hypothetical protein
MYPIAKFIVTVGIKVKSGIGMSYWLHRLAGWYDNPMLESAITPIQGLGILLQASSECESGSRHA